ncbi:tetratricopeptide repeat protein [Thiotrichales bacterium HSG1]|nr:tetratricopeptide repeat protein [Thiotrichales bacterium HSG1]
MSLLMDALKKVDETIDSPTITSENNWDETVDSSTITSDENNWDGELLSQFQQDDLSTSPDPQPEKLDNVSEKWEDEFLPQFQNEPNSKINDIQEDIVEDVKTDVPTVSPPIETEVKLPNNDKLSDVDEIQKLFSLSDKEYSEKAEDPQIPMLGINEQSPLEKPVKSTEYQPQDAQRIFIAGQTNQSNDKSKHSSKRTIWSVAILGIMVIGIGAGYYFLQPLLNLEQSPPLQLGKLSQRSTANPIPVEQPLTLKVKQPVVTEQPTKKVQDENITPVKPPLSVTIDKIKKIKPIIKTPKPVPIKLPKAIPEQKANIRTLKKKVNVVEKDLSKAYNALQSGNNKKAKRAYQQVLRHDKNNRDALLGMAALAVRDNNIQQAQQFYRLILRKYPKDNHAQVGLINSFGNNPKSETKLKLLLRESPKAAYIHFSLGNLYASQGRWELAQPAYFEAMRYDKKHAGYAYNLAISLDHINQPKAALTYYQRALNLANNQKVNFNPKTVQKRIDTLTKVLK